MNAPLYPWKSRFTHGRCEAYQIVIYQHEWYNLISDSVPHGGIRPILEHYITSLPARNMSIDHTINSSRRRRNLMNHPSINFLRAPESISNLLHLSLDTTGPFSALRVP